MLNVRFMSGMLIALSGAALSGCFEVDVGSTANDAAGSGSSELLPVEPALQPTTDDLPNTAPSISGVAATQIMAGSRYEFRPAALDSDGDTLQFRANGLPGWAGIDAGTGMVSGTPRTTDAGQTADILISVSDGTESADLPPFKIAVTTPSTTAPPAAPNNSRPLIGGAPGTSVQAQGAYSFRPTASDPDGQSLSFSVTNKPSWAAFSTATGTLSGTPGRDQDGTYSNIIIAVSDGSLSAMLPSFAIVVSPAPNAAPTISGSPPATVLSDSSYSFRPTASDPDGDALSFTVTGKPAWAAFDGSTGSLSGSPSVAQAGTYSNIVIRVSDGRVTASLPAFSVVVNSPALGSATLSWSAPSQNTDGSAITDLSGYRIHYGTSVGSLGTMIQVSNPGITTYVIDNLSSGTYHFAVIAYNSSGVESDRSPVGSKAIP